MSDQDETALTRQNESVRAAAARIEKTALATDMPKFDGTATIKRYVTVDGIRRGPAGAWTEFLVRDGGSEELSRMNEHGPLFLEDSCGLLVYNIDPNMLGAEFEIEITVRRVEAAPKGDTNG